MAGSSISSVLVPLSVEDLPDRKAIDLAIGVEWQRWESDDPGGNHVGGERFLAGFDDMPEIDLLILDAAADDSLHAFLGHGPRHRYGKVGVCGRTEDRIDLLEIDPAHDVE